MRKYLYGIMTLSLIMTFSQSATAKIDESKVKMAVRSSVMTTTFLDKEGNVLGTNKMPGAPVLNIGEGMDPAKAKTLVMKKMANHPHAKHHEVTDPETGETATLFNLGNIIKEGVGLVTNVIGTVAPIAVPLAAAAIPAVIALAAG
jgi:uncharacterized protein GlcG (DUF336 family)